MTVKIVTDSLGDIPSEIAEEARDCSNSNAYLAEVRC